MPWQRVTKCRLPVKKASAVSGWSKGALFLASQNSMSAGLLTLGTGGELQTVHGPTGFAPDAVPSKPSRRPTGDLDLEKFFTSSRLARSKNRFQWFGRKELRKADHFKQQPAEQQNSDSQSERFSSSGIAVGAARSAAKPEARHWPSRAMTIKVVLKYQGSFSSPPGVARGERCTRNSPQCLHLMAASWIVFGAKGAFFHGDIVSAAAILRS